VSRSRKRGFSATYGVPLAFNQTTELDLIRPVV
jgi:hypothetical protein